MNIGIMLPNWIGDVAMATPTLRALRNHFADANIVGVMRPYVANVLEGVGWLDDRVFFDPRSSDPKLHSLSLIRQLRERELDYVILMTNSLRAGAIAWLSGAKSRVGYVRYGRGLLLNHKLHPPRIGMKLAPVSAVDYYLELAYAVGCPPEARRMELSTTRDDEAAAERVWDKLGLTNASRVVLLNTGSAANASKSWPIDYFATVAKRIVEDPDVAVLINCGPKERDSAAEMENMVAHPRVTSLAREEDLPIGLSKACIRRSDLVVTTDSGPRHIAAALGTPAVSIFGATDPSWTLTYNPAEVNLQHDIECAPCWKKKCPLGHHRCMTELTPERVYDVVQRQLGTFDKQTA